MLKTISLILFCILPQFLWAFDDVKPELYQVEIIIFENTPSFNEYKEDLSNLSLAPELTHAIELRRYSSDEPLKPFSLLPASKLLMKREKWLFSRQNKYKVLLHYAWLQPMDDTKTIHIASDSHADKKSDDSYSQNKANQLDVNGVLRINKTNYFNLTTDMQFSGSINGKPLDFLFNQSRRLRSDETHYLDHPLIGMLVKIHPLSKTS